MRCAVRMSTTRLASAAALVLALGATALAHAAPGGAAAPSAQAGDEPRIVTVVKLRNFGWFDRMAEGIREFAGQRGIDAAVRGPKEASAEQQAELLRRIVAQRPDAITVVPNSPRALEPVLRRARRAGIAVVTHEASNQRNTDVDIEAFDNFAFGPHLMDRLAGCMGETGTYVAFIGNRSARSHRVWVRTALEAAQADHPGITRLGDPRVSREDEDVAYRKAKAILAEHPEVTGFEGSSAVDVAGIGRAVREAGRQATTCVMGTSSPDTVGDLLDDGSVDRIFLGDPAVAGVAQHKLALRILRGQDVGPGLDLHLPGYRDLRRIPGTPHALHGDALIDVDRSNADEYPF